jgi:hypothetical protein
MNSVATSTTGSTTLSERLASKSRASISATS